MRRRNAGERAVLLGLLGFSAGLLLVCSGTSPLYRGHDWTDANTYLTMGRGLLQGAVPYRDLFDHKGPLLYVLYALGAWLHPEGFWGVWILQILSLAGTLYALYRTARCWGTEPLPALAGVCALPVLLLSAGVYYLPETLDYGGGSAEEFCLPWFAGALWLSAAQERNSRWSPKALAALGALAGAVIQIKFSLALFFAGLMAPVVLRMLLRGEARRLPAGAGWCGLGLGVCLLPELLYAAATRSLGALVRAYICFNASYAQGDAASLSALLWRALSAAGRAVFDTPALLAALAAFAAGLAALGRRRGAAACLPPLTAFAALGAAVFVGRVMPYTLLPLLLSASYGIFALGQMGPRLSRRGAALLLAGLSLAAAGSSQMLFHKPVAWRAAPTCQEQMAALIRSGQSPEPSVLEAGMLSRGFYNQLNQVPKVYYFYVPNVTDQQHPEILEGQLQAIREQRCGYVILQSSRRELSLAHPPEEARLRRLYAAVLAGGYRPAAVLPGTGAVEGLWYHLFERTGGSKA